MQECKNIAMFIGKNPNLVVNSKIANLLFIKNYLLVIKILTYAMI